jgi:cytochrome c
MVKATTAIFATLLALAGTATLAQAPAAGESPELKRGKLLFIQCRACHEVQAGLPHKVGPNLAGVLGRQSGTAAGFNYSPALKASGVTWDRVQLDRWLEKPSAVVAGNAMAFAGVANPKDRAALIAYIEAETTKP